MSLAKALPANLIREFGGQKLEFRTIGLDTWSSFSDFVVAQKSKRIHAMPIEKSEKALMLKELVSEGIDMMSLLTEAQTLEGMSELVCQCCVTKGIKRKDLERVIPVTEVPVMFTRLSDIEQDDSQGEEVGNESSDPKNGA